MQDTDFSISVIYPSQLHYRFETRTQMPSVRVGVIGGGAAGISACG